MVRDLTSGIPPTWAFGVVLGVSRLASTPSEQAKSYDLSKASNYNMFDIVMLGRAISR